MPADAWYAGAVAWAAENGIVTGNADGTFAPERRVTRAELAILLWRQAELLGSTPASSGDLSAYADGESVATFARQAVAWALEAGLYDALVTDTIYPNLPVSREQFAQVCVAFLAAVEGEPLAVELAAMDSRTPVVSASQANHDAIQAAVDAAAEQVRRRGRPGGGGGGRRGDRHLRLRLGHPRQRPHDRRPPHAGGLHLQGAHRPGDHAPAGAGGGGPGRVHRGVLGRQRREPLLPGHPGDAAVHAVPHLLHQQPGGRRLPTATAPCAPAWPAAASAACMPGAIASWSYNNYAFGVLGQTIELASGMCMDDLLRRDLFDVMGIDGAFAAGDLEDSSQLVTLVYHGGGVARSVSTQRSLHAPDTPGASGSYFFGGLNISVSDLAKIDALLANDGNYEGLQLVEPETVELMETIDPTQLSDGTYQGLPLRCQRDIYGRGTLYYHTGSAYGVYNCMSYDPDTGDGVVVLTVGASGAKDERGIYAICGEISQYVYTAIR